MKTKYLINFIALTFFIISSVIITSSAFAQEPVNTGNIQYPIEELGDCENQESCRIFCDKPENTENCLGFARENNLMLEEEIDKAEKFLALEKEGPGGCEGKEECEEYCNDINHIDECISFAEENNLIPPEELEEAKKVQAAIKRGVKPPPCGNKEQCDVYCDDPEHMEECITFGIEAGFIQGKELEDVQKMLAAVKKGIKPPNCKGKKACDEYCNEPEHMEECMTFAMEAGFMSEQEKADSQKMLEALKKGAKPPNCRGKEECDVYCSQEEHFEECLNFAEAAGFMTLEEAAMARKTGGKGPGGCKGKEECEAFCNNPDNQETCFNFAKENGLIPEEDLKMMEEGKQKFRESLEQAPQEVIDCLNSVIGTEMMEKIKSGSVMPPREIGDQMGQCFGKMGPPPGQEGMMQEGQTGPGGCKTPEECKSYCESNPEECKNLQIPQKQIPQGQPCEGENCKYGPLQGQLCEGENCQQYGPPPCEGENCQYGPPPQDINQYQPPTMPVSCEGPDCFQSSPPPTGEGVFPPPGSTAPGEGGTIPPGEPVPQMSPTDQIPPAGQTAPSESSPPPPPSSESLPGSLFQTIIRFFNRIFGL